MSDALTDIARDQRRAEARRKWLIALGKYLLGRGTKKAVLEAAEACDSIPRGYWGRQTQLAKRTNKIIQKLKARDPETCLWFWEALHDSFYWFPTLEEYIEELKRHPKAYPKSPNTYIRQWKRENGFFKDEIANFFGEEIVSRIIKCPFCKRFFLKRDEI